MKVKDKLQSHQEKHFDTLLEKKVINEIQSDLIDRYFGIRIRVFPLSEQNKNKSSPFLVHLKNQLKNELKTQIQWGAIESSKLRTSVSHTDWGETGILVVAGSDQSIGVDIENIQRNVHPRLGWRISTLNEMQFRLEALELWTIKEAAFKANPTNQGTTISQYHVVEWDESRRQGRVQYSPNYLYGECFFKLIQIERWNLAIAFWDDMISK